jgi:3-hydroxybutyryl-CoA dehydrogenase
MTLAFSKVAIIGAGAMGRGIAQIATQAGSQVWLYDTQAEAIAKARNAVFQQWDKLQEKGRLSPETVADYKIRLLSAASMQDLAECELVVEAIVEKIDIKKSLFTELEQVLAPTAVLVTNTSSLSVTAIAAALQRPSQFAGYHFFNPVPLMKVVEVIAGLKTDQAVCERLSEFARQMELKLASYSWMACSFSPKHTPAIFSNMTCKPILQFSGRMPLLAITVSCCARISVLRSS